jgi:uncharacterized protein with GYD domain
MANYVMLLSLTDQGIQTMKNWSDRVRDAEQVIAAGGGRLKEIYLTMGGYDFVAIIEAPDDEAAAKLAMTIGGRGNVKTQTLRAFSRDEVVKMTQGLP